MATGDAGPDRYNIGENNAALVGPNAEANVGIYQHIGQEDPLLGGSRRQPREEDDEDEEGSSKRFRWWDELADSDSDAGYDSDDSSTGYESENSDDSHRRCRGGPTFWSRKESKR